MNEQPTRRECFDIPLSPGNSARLWIPRPITLEEYEQLMRILELYKPGLTFAAYASAIRAASKEADSFRAGSSPND